MAEAGGPANQAGIFFQNTIAALYLGRMVDLRSRARRDRVLHVRVEAPEAVDDIVVLLGDGSRRYIQAKRSIDVSSDAWDRVWQQFWQQLVRPTTALEDRLLLVLGEPSKTAADLEECCRRTTDAVDHEEYLTKRLNEGQRSLFSKIETALAGYAVNADNLRALLSRVDVEVYSHALIERDHAPLWMPDSNCDPSSLLARLRDMVGGASIVRGTFEPARLLERLRSEGVVIGEPQGWGADSYRSVLTGKAVIEVPGTGVVKPIDETFIWPRAHRYDRSHRADFDDEVPNPWFGIRPDSVNVSNFPTAGFDRVVVVSGPGFGKSTLSLALAKSAAERGLLPAIISIHELAKQEGGVGRFLQDQLNAQFEVSVDWTRAAEAGLLVLFFDGLDEVSIDRRAVMLERVKTFSLRYPAVPWLLTVRDAAALAAPTDALLVELDALDTDDIGRYISFYRPNDAGFGERLQQAFTARPDLERLVRIPLFLAILLCSGLEVSELPSKRTELLEAYLHLLFRPEQFKGAVSAVVDPAALRPIAELIAYDSLEREEIGVDARRLEASVRNALGLGQPVQPALDRLITCGVLRPSGPARFVFPFPVVQEYLAACYILDFRMEGISGRLSSASKRPWAQTLQFVLERHPHPIPLVTSFLAQEDDAFGTGMRLMARCVANGMSVTTPLKTELTRRLCRLWPSAAWRLRGRIGALIAAAFCDPMIPELRALLSNRWLLHHGAGTVVAQIKSPDLTRSVLADFLAGDIEHLLNLAEMQPAVSALGDEALDIYVARARRDGASEKELEAISSLIGHLDPAQLSDEHLLAVALDERLPIYIRLEAFGLHSTPVDPRAMPLVEAALGMPGYHTRSAAVEIIMKLKDPVSSLRDALMRSDLKMKEKLDLLGYLPRGLLPAQKAEICRTLSQDDGIQDELRRRLSIFGARYGNSDSMCALVEAADRLPIADLRTTIAIFGHHRSRSLVETLILRLKERTFSPSDRAGLTSSIVLGMTALFQMDMFEGGLIDVAPLHPGADLFLPLLEEWAAMEDYEPIDGLNQAEGFARFGSEAALSAIEQRLKQVLDSKRYRSCRF
ncbi:hypothetical protein GPL21_13025 [Bradyrhizobium pachyrhizi]|uniref:NACHT domain-containing protein n=1 Tax=Bradyrhizobium pachyrhizi TaxID=280333 RepID=A0A844SGB8_9BRAD|nr:hypothetical protein [Bradyrhizobium pachyrhizi]MVT66028.1 hypothetical protein [Bradyrhizobium pachyrhizi]